MLWGSHGDEGLPKRNGKKSKGMEMENGVLWGVDYGVGGSLYHSRASKIC